MTLVPTINTSACPGCEERCDQCAPEVELIDTRTGARCTGGDLLYEIVEDGE